MPAGGEGEERRRPYTSALRREDESTLARARHVPATSATSERSLHPAYVTCREKAFPTTLVYGVRLTYIRVICNLQLLPAFPSAMFKISSVHQFKTFSRKSFLSTRYRRTTHPHRHPKRRSCIPACACLMVNVLPRERSRTPIPVNQSRTSLPCRLIACTHLGPFSYRLAPDSRTYRYSGLS